MPLHDGLGWVHSKDEEPLLLEHMQTPGDKLLIGPSVRTLDAVLNGIQAAHPPMSNLTLVVYVPAAHWRAAEWVRECARLAGLVAAPGIGQRLLLAEFIRDAFLCDRTAAQAAAYQVVQGVHVVAVSLPASEASLVGARACVLNYFVPAYDVVVISQGIEFALLSEEAPFAIAIITYYAGPMFVSSFTKLTYLLKLESWQRLLELDEFCSFIDEASAVSQRLEFCDDRGIPALGVDVVNLWDILVGDSSIMARITDMRLCLREMVRPRARHRRWVEVDLAPTRDGSGEAIPQACGACGGDGCASGHQWPHSFEYFVYSSGAGLGDNG